MNPRYLILVSLSIGLLGCVPAFPEVMATPTRTLQEETYAVYSAMIEHTILRNVKRTDIEIHRPVTQVVIDNFTVDGTKYLEHKVAGLTEDTKQSFLENNAKLGKLEEKFVLRVPYVLHENKQILGGTDAFDEHYPGAQGLMFLSPIGFNKSHTQALVYVENTIGFGTGSSGYLVLMTKQTGVWQVVRVQLVWIS